MKRRAIANAIDTSLRLLQTDRIDCRNLEQFTQPGDPELLERALKLA